MEVKDNQKFHQGMMLSAARGFFELGWKHGQNIGQMSNGEKIVMVPAIVMNMSFAAELLLKFLCISEDVPFPYTHELNSLFDKISNEKREKIRSEYENLMRTGGLTNAGSFLLSKHKKRDTLPSPNMNDLDTFLLNHNHAFKEWRYIFELKPTSYQVHANIRALFCFIKALHSQILDLQQSTPPTTFPQ